MPGRLGGVRPEGGVGGVKCEAPVDCSLVEYELGGGDMVSSLDITPALDEELIEAGISTWWIRVTVETSFLDWMMADGGFLSMPDQKKVATLAGTRTRYIPKYLRSRTAET